MKNKKHLLLAGIVMISAGKSFAQDVSKLYSPNLFDGTVNISIPIYEQYGMGISLSYNTKGIPVRELAGVAGLHWNLNVGGGISKVIKGLPDDIRILVHTDEQYSFDPAGVPVLAAYDMYKGRLQVALEQPSERSNTKIFRDTESDEYYVSAGNIRFTFYVGENGGIFTNSFSDYEIRFFRDGAYRLPSDQSSSQPYNFIDGNPISIRDKKTNIVYYFGPGIKRETVIPAHFRSEASFLANPYNTEFFSGEKGGMITNWNLDSVRYDAERTVRYTYSRFQIPFDIAQDSSWVRPENPNQSSSFPQIAPVFNSSNFDMVSAITYPNGIKVELNYEGGNTRFEMRPNPNSSSPANTYPKLNEVVVKEGLNAMRYLFDYTYFHNPSGTSSLQETSTYLGDERDRYSLKLKGIRQVSADGTLSQSLYTFGYNNLIQRRFGGGLDFYGYFNGQNMGIAAHSIPPTANKTDNSIYGQYGLLTSITSGTGGKASFFYGTHQLTDVSSPLMSNNADLVGGGANDGVRIEWIETTDLNDTTVFNRTRFIYWNGQRFLSKGFARDESTYRGGGWYTGNPASSTFLSVTRNWYETFVSPMGLYNGSNHGYSTVTVEQKNQYGQLLSETNYEFSNFKDLNGSPKVLVTGGGSVAIDKPFTQKQRIRDWEIGQLLKVTNYDSKGLLISEATTEYESIVDTISSVAAGLNEAKRIVEPKPSGWLFANTVEQTRNWIADFEVVLDPYKPYRGVSRPKKVVTRKYSSDTRFMADSILYTYDSRYNIKTTLFNNSRGELLQQVNVYNYDLPLTDINNNADLTNLKQQGMEVLVGNEQWKMGSGSQQQQWVNSKLVSAAIYKIGLVGDIPVTKAVYNMESVNPVMYTNYTGLNINSNPDANPYQFAGMAYNNPSALPDMIVPVTDVKAFDNRGNVSETYIAATMQYKTVLFEQSNDKKIVEITNARKTDIAYADFDQNVQGNITFTRSNIIFPGSGFTNINAPTLPVPGVKPMSGKGLYVLTNTTQKDLFTMSLTPGKQYRLTVWITDNILPSFGIENGTQFTLKEIASVGRFKQYEAFFSPTAPGQKIGFHTTGNVGIEDIRIHPVEAVMQSWYYEPLFGAGSSTDALGRITYYQYDNLGRPVLTRNQAGQILSKNEYRVIN